MKTYKVDVLEERDENGYYGNEKGTIIWREENGCYHCEHGPSVIQPDGTVHYHWHGVQYTKATWEKCVALSKKHIVTLEDGTEVVLSNESYENLKNASS